MPADGHRGRREDARGARQKLGWHGPLTLGTSGHMTPQQAEGGEYACQPNHEWPSTHWLASGPKTHLQFGCTERRCRRRGSHAVLSWSVVHVGDWGSTQRPQIPGVRGKHERVTAVGCWPPCEHQTCPLQTSVVKRIFVQGFFVSGNPLITCSNTERA